MPIVNAEAKPEVSQWLQFDGTNVSEVASLLVGGAQVYGTLNASGSLNGSLVCKLYNGLSLLIPVDYWVRFSDDEVTVLSDSDWHNLYVEV